MANMTVARYEELRKTVLDFLQLKINNIDILNWSYAEMFIILSMFREYFEQLIPYGRRKIVYFLNKYNLPLFFLL